MDDWLTRARDVLAAEAGNAPLLCYLVGHAQGTRPLDELAEPLRRLKS